MGDAYVKWMSNLTEGDLYLVGAKAMSLSKLFSQKYPVPQAFVVTTEGFNHFMTESGLLDTIKQKISEIDVDNTYELRKRTEEIQQMIINADMPKVLETSILEAYDHFNVDLKGLKDSPGALAILKSAREPVFVSVRSSGPHEDSDTASFAGQQESFINIKGNSDLVFSIKKVFASIFTARSLHYRAKHGFDSMVPMAAVIQRMINAEKSGVIFSRHPIKGTEEVLIESSWGLGQGILSGKIKPDQHVLSKSLEIIDEHISNKKVAVVRNASGQTKTVELKDDVSATRTLKTHELKTLAEYAMKIEQLFGSPQDIEFAIENQELYILQSRPITTLSKVVEPQKIEGHLLAHGLAASPGVASGSVKIIKSQEDYADIKEGDVIVTSQTHPDMILAMQKASGIITTEGGITSHAAILAREMHIPAVVGAQDALQNLDEGIEVTIDGLGGNIFRGATQNKSVEIEPVVETNVKVEVKVDLPTFAERAAQTNPSGIGLICLEGMIAAKGKHPLYYESQQKLSDYESLIHENLKLIAEKFIGKGIWVRLGDMRSDEYNNLEGSPERQEKNPLLGFHGIRFSLKHEDLFRTELRAVKKLSDLGHSIGILLPNVVDISEVQSARKIFEEEGCADKVHFGIIVETPAASVIIKDLVKEPIERMLFDTNHLTQYTLAMDRSNNDVNPLYNELSWAVLKQISRVIRECKEKEITTSLCGTATSNPKLLEYLVKHGINSVTVDAEIAHKVSETIERLESGSSAVDIISKPKEDNVEEDEEIVVPEKPQQPMPEEQNTQPQNPAMPQAQQVQPEKAPMPVQETQHSQEVQQSTIEQPINQPNIQESQPVQENTSMEQNISNEPVPPIAPKQPESQLRPVPQMVVEDTNKSVDSTPEQSPQPEQAPMNPQVPNNQQINQEQQSQQPVPEQQGQPSIQAPQNVQEMQNNQQMTSETPIQNNQQPTQEIHPAPIQQQPQSQVPLQTQPDQQANQQISPVEKPVQENEEESVEKVEDKITEIPEEVYIEELSEHEEQQKEFDQEQDYIIDQHKKDYEEETSAEVQEDAKEIADVEKEDEELDKIALREIGEEVEGGLEEHKPEEVQPEKEERSEEFEKEIEQNPEMLRDVGELIEGGLEEHNEDDSPAHQEEEIKKGLENAAEEDEEDVLQKIIEDAHDVESRKSDKSTEDIFN